MQVGRLKLAAVPVDFSIAGPGLNLSGGFGRHDADGGVGRDESADFSFGDGSCADDEATTSLEFEEHRENFRRRFSCGHFGRNETRCTRRASENKRPTPDGDAPEISDENFLNIFWNCAELSSNLPRFCGKVISMAATQTTTAAARVAFEYPSFGLYQIARFCIVLATEMQSVARLAGV